MDNYQLIAFIEESNGIEGIRRPVHDDELQVARMFIEKNELVIDDLVNAVNVFQPYAVLRKYETVPGVRVGKHIAPPSGPVIVSDLQEILNRANEQIGPNDPLYIYQDYEQLHPFTDGNGRSGRLLWLHCSLRNSDWRELASTQFFLHTYHYQTLAAL